MTNQYRYKVLYARHDAIEETINPWGQMGYRLVSIHQESNRLSSTIVMELIV